MEYSNEEIMKFNTLIAKFMGLVYRTEKGYEGWYYFDGIIKFPYELNFHEDLYMLMEVVDKILDIEFKNQSKFELLIQSRGASLYNSFTGIGFEYKSRRMGSISNYLISNMIIYKLVVDFINWYNRKEL